MWILDWLGRAQTALWIVAGLAGTAVSGIGALMQASPLQILFLFIAGCLLGLGVLIAWQNYRSFYPVSTQTLQAKQPSPLKIEFEDYPATPYFRADIANSIVTKSPWAHGYQIRIRSPMRQVSNVRVLLTTWQEIPNTPAEQPIVYNLHHPLAFAGEEVSINFNKGDAHLVPIIRFTRAAMATRWITVEGMPKAIFHHDQQHKIQITVTGDDIEPLDKLYVVWVEDSKLCMMVNATS
jgi:hypothetical protein